MNAPQLRFPGFNEPWETKTFSDVFERVRAKNAENNQNVLTISAQNGLVAQDSFFSKLVAAKDVTGYYLLHRDDFAYNRSYSSGYPMGAIKRLTNYDKGIVSTLYICFKARDPKIVNFLEQYFESGTFNKEIEKIAQEGARNHGLLNVGTSEFFGTMLATPSPDEAVYVAGFLNLLDTKSASLEKKIALFKQYKKVIAQKIFTQHICFKATRHVYPDWQEKKLRAMEEDGQITLGRGNVISKKDIAAHPGNYPIYSSSIRNQGLFGRYGKYMFDEELVTWSIDGGGNFFYRPVGKFSVTNVSGWLRVIDRSLDCRFLALQLQYLHEKLLFDYQVKAHPSVIREMYKLGLPALEEQQKIADFLTLIDDTIKQEEAKLTQVRAFKKALTQRMFI